jgi:hypothetical protein
VGKRCDVPSTSAAHDFKTNGVLDPSSNLVKTVDCQHGGGGTAYANGIGAAQQQLAATDAHDGRGAEQNVIVLLSDGAANRGPTYYDPASPYRTQPCHQGITSAGVAKAAGTMVDPS